MGERLRKNRSGRACSFFSLIGTSRPEWLRRQFKSEFYYFLSFFFSFFLFFLFFFFFSFSFFSFSVFEICSTKIKSSKRFFLSSAGIARLFCGRSPKRMDLLYAAILKPEPETGSVVVRTLLLHAPLKPRTPLICTFNTRIPDCRDSGGLVITRFFQSNPAFPNLFWFFFFLIKILISFESSYYVSNKKFWIILSHFLKILMLFNVINRFLINIKVKFG